MILNGDDCNILARTADLISSMCIDMKICHRDYSHEVDRLAHVLRRFFCGDAEIGMVKAVLEDVRKKYSNTGEVME